MPTIPALARLSQEDQEFKINWITQRVTGQSGKHEIMSSKLKKSGEYYILKKNILHRVRSCGLGNTAKADLVQETKAPRLE